VARLEASKYTLGGICSLTAKKLVYYIFYTSGTLFVQTTAVSHTTDAGSIPTPPGASVQATRPLYRPVVRFSDAWPRIDMD